MEQRIYHGQIDPNALADYLVGTFNQPAAPYYHHPHGMAQKVRQGELVYVQIMRSGDWIGHEHGSLSVQIQRIAGGVSVGMGQADWLDLDQAGLAGMLFGALFFPPLLVFPVIHGLARSTFSQDVWDAIETYCWQARPVRPRSPQGFYCPYCGAFNHPTSVHCHACGAPFHQAPPPQPAQPQPAAWASQPPPAPAPESEPAAEEPAPEYVVCPSCGTTVAAAKFCGNCAAPLRRE